MAVRGARSKLYPSSSAFPAPGHEGLSYLYGRERNESERGKITRWKGWCCEGRRPESRDQPEMGSQGHAVSVSKVEGQ